MKFYFANYLHILSHILTLYAYFIEFICDRVLILAVNYFCESPKYRDSIN